MFEVGTRSRRKVRAREYVERRLISRDFDDLADILRGAEQTLEWAPSRSTFYQWVRDWRLARARDKSGNWSLATDDSGRPDVVLDVMSALVNRSGGRIVVVTNAEARWMVRLATAAPLILQEAEVLFGDPAFGWGTLRLYEWSLRYVDAETAGNAERMAELDSLMAMLYASRRAPLPGTDAKGAEE